MCYSLFASYCGYANGILSIDAQVKLPFLQVPLPQCLGILSFTITVFQPVVGFNSHGSCGAVFLDLGNAGAFLTFQLLDELDAKAQA